MKRLKYIAPVKAGITLGILYAFLGLIFIPFFMLMGFGAAAASHAAGGSAFPLPLSFLFGVGALFVPIFYGVMGFIGGIIAAALYNLVARWTGGLEFTVEDVT